MTMIQEKPSLEELVHFGIKGMHWGSRKKSTSTGQTTPSRPRKNSTKSEGRPQTREDIVVSRAIQQGYARVVGPPMAKFVRDIPPHQKSSDPKIQAVLDRALSQGLDRVEANAGKAFVQGLPAQFRP